jgi:hypothetical protein
LTVKYGSSDVTDDRDTSYDTGHDLPDGLSVSGHGLISGTPTYNRYDNWHDGHATFTIEVEHEVSRYNTVHADYTLTLNLPDAPSISNQTTYVATNGNLSYQVVATGTGLSYSKQYGSDYSLNRSTGVLSGHVSSHDGSSTVKVTVEDAYNRDDNGYITVVREDAPALGNGTPNDGIVGQAYDSWRIPASGTDVSLSATGLPDGLSISNGKIVGTPDAGDQPGAFTVTVTAANHVGSVDKDYTLNLYGVPTISTQTLPIGVVGDEYLDNGNPVQLQSTGFGVTYEISGDTPLPSWASFDASTGVFSGTPDNESSTPILVRASNAAGTSDWYSYQLAVFAVPVVTTHTLPNAIADKDYNATIAASGNDSTFAITDGALPSGLTLNADGTISGKTTATGTFTVQVVATNDAGSSAPQTLTIKVTKPAQTLSTASVSADGTVVVKGTGFLPGDRVEIWLHSNPVLLDTVTAGNDGAFSAKVTIPASTAPGAHRIESRGAQSGSVFTDVTVAASMTPAGLAQTGSDLAPWALGSLLALLVGAGVFLVARRRKTVGE